MKFQVTQFLLIKELGEPSEPLAFWGNSKMSLTTSLLNTLPILNSDNDCLDQSQRILDEYHHYYLYKGLLQDNQNSVHSENQGAKLHDYSSLQCKLNLAKAPTTEYYQDDQADEKSLSDTFEQLPEGCDTQ